MMRSILSQDPPAGVPERETQYYNPYFAGGWIGMPAPLNDGAVDYDDGTPNTSTQAAISQFHTSSLHMCTPSLHALSLHALFAHPLFTPLVTPFSSHPRRWRRT